MATAMVIFLKRRPELTEKQFYEYWAKTHGPLVAPWAAKHGVLTYKQVGMPQIHHFYLISFITT